MVMKGRRSVSVELGFSKHFSHNVVDVFVDGVTCERSVDKRVCDWLSENFRCSVLD